MSEEIRRSVYAATIKHLVYAERELVDGRYVVVQETAVAYAYSPPDRSFVRFHINFLPLMMQQLEADRIDTSQIRRHHHEMTVDQVTVCEYRKQPNDDEEREYQTIINGNLHKEGANKVINLQPGAGKTKITMNFVGEFGVRWQGIMSAKYLAQWANEMDKFFYAKKKDVMLIQGAPALRAMMQMQLDGELEAKAIFVSIETFASYLDAVEKGLVPDDYFPIHPDDYFVKMGIGLNVIDEAHQNPHRLCRLFCHMNVLKNISLSATLKTKDPFKNKIYQMLYPEDQRDTGGYKSIYIGANCIHYKMKRPGRIRFTGWKGSYNHTKFEESILKHSNKKELDNYMSMLKYYVQTTYMDVKKPGQKAIIFFSTKNMCTYARNYFSKAFPSIKTVRYIGEDDRKVMDDADFVVSTVLSAGTAVDIPNLIVNWLTINVDSQISNEQTVGRTRPVKNEPGRTPMFFWFCCDDIDKHRKYTSNKKEFLEDKVLYINDIQSPFEV